MLDCDGYVTRSLNDYVFVSSSASSDVFDDDDGDMDCNAKTFCLF